MKRLLVLLYIFLIVSCTPKSYDLVDNKVSVNEIKLLELRSDNDRIIANGIGEMEFRVVAYGIREAKERYIEKINGNVTYHDSLRLDTFVIPQDQYPSGLVEVYDEDNNVIKNSKFKIEKKLKDKKSFYAKMGDLESEMVQIEIRETPDESYEEIVFPVIFHIIMPPAYSVPAMDMTTEFAQKKLDVLNAVFNRELTTNPNGGNAKMKFKLAKYNERGVLLEKPGLNEVHMQEKLDADKVKKYMKENLIWDPNKYLNIWIADISKRYWSSDGSSSYEASQPTLIIKGEKPIPGINAKETEEFELTEETELTDVGIVYNAEDFLSPTIMGGTSFDLETVMGEYLGLLPMGYSKVWDYTKNEWVENIVDDDTDFCPDTNVPSYPQEYSIYKTDMFSGKYFTSFNIMVSQSRKNSITADQATRIRDVLRKCPGRWSYKSDWAFNGR